MCEMILYESWYNGCVVILHPVCHSAALLSFQSLQRASKTDRLVCECPVKLRDTVLARAGPLEHVHGVPDLATLIFISTKSVHGCIGASSVGYVGGDAVIVEVVLVTPRADSDMLQI